MRRREVVSDDEALILVDQALATCRRYVSGYWPAIETVAELLVERGRVGRRKVGRIVLRQR